MGHIADAFLYVSCGGRCFSRTCGKSACGFSDTANAFFQSFQCYSAKVLKRAFCCIKVADRFRADAGQSGELLEYAVISTAHVGKDADIGGL